MERQFCKRFSQWTIIVGDYLDFKQWGVWVGELEYAVIQPPPDRKRKVISTLKEIKMKNSVCNLFPISFTKIKNVWILVWMYRTVCDIVKLPYLPFTMTLQCILRWTSIICTAQYTAGTSEQWSLFSCCYSGCLALLTRCFAVQLRQY